MADRTGRLEQHILVLFKLAYRRGRPDIAEHLLRALETLEREPGAQEPARCRRSLMEAYGELIRPH